MSRKQHPVWACWKAQSGTAVGLVWLAERRADGREVWKWRFERPGETPKGDWTPSREIAVFECRTKLSRIERIRFARCEDMVNE